MKIGTLALVTTISVAAAVMFVPTNIVPANATEENLLVFEAEVPQIPDQEETAEEISVAEAQVVPVPGYYEGEEELLSYYPMKVQEERPAATTAKEVVEPQPAPAPAPAAPTPAPAPVSVPEYNGGGDTILFDGDSISIDVIVIE